MYCDNAALKLEVYYIMDHLPYENFESFFKDLINRKENAWQVMCDKYGRLFSAFFARRGIPDEEAEDIAQHIYIKLWEYVLDAKFGENDFEDERAFISYLLKIANSKIVDNYRYNIKRLLSVDSLGNMESFSEKESFWQGVNEYFKLNPEKNKLLREKVEEILNTISNRKHIEIFKNYYFNNKTSKEIAQEYSTTKGNIRIILFRVRNKLISDLKEQSI